MEQSILIKISPEELQKRIKDSIQEALQPLLHSKLNRFGEYPEPMSVYVEGLIYNGTFLLHHACMECSDGIIECTIRDSRWEYLTIMRYIPATRKLLKRKAEEVIDYLHSIGKECTFLEFKR